MCQVRKVIVLVLACWVAMPVAQLSAASVSGRRNTAIGTSAATLYHAVKGHTGEAIGFGVGSAYAWKRYEDARRRESRRRRVAASGATYSSARYSSPSRASSGSGGSAATVAALNTSLSAVKEQAAFREAAMQQNLDELAAQVRGLERQNERLNREAGLSRHELTDLRMQAQQSQSSLNRYLISTVIAGAVAIASLAALLYRIMRGREISPTRKWAPTS